MSSMKFTFNYFMFLGFVFKFDKNGLDLYLESTYFDCGYIYDGWIVLNIDYFSYNNANEFIFYTS